VEAEADARETLEALLQVLRGSGGGPAAARVDEVEAVFEEDAEPRFASFRIGGSSSGE
jgi:hypothetical protein